MSRYKVKGKRHKKRGIVARYSALPDRPAAQNTSVRAIALVLAAVFFLGLYLASLVMRDTKYMAVSVWITMGLYTLLPLLFIIFLLLNQGLSNDIPTREQLSDGMTDEEKDAFIARIAACRRRARPWLIPIIPLAVIVGFDIVYYYIFG